MQHSPIFNNKIIRILLSIIMGGTIMIGVAYAIDSKLDGWVSTVAVKNITIHDDSCRQLSGAAGYFVPTRTATEWNAFNAVAASKGLTVASCVTYVYNWRSYMPQPPVIGYFSAVAPGLGVVKTQWYAGANFCNREIVGASPWNAGSVSVAESFCSGTNAHPTGGRCKWYDWDDPNGQPFLYECH